MSTTASSDASIVHTTNPWKPLLDSQLPRSPALLPEFNLSTLHPPTTTHPFPTPRVRTLIFRGWWTELPLNEKNLLWDKLNPTVRKRQLQAVAGGGEKWESDILTFTTDARMSKAAYDLFWTPPMIPPNACWEIISDTHDLWQHPHGLISSPGFGGRATTSGNSDAGADLPEQIQELHLNPYPRPPVPPKSGGGAWAEAMFWIPNAKTQWRLRGPCYLLSALDIGIDDADKYTHVQRLRRILESRVRAPKDADVEKEFSYVDEVLAHFANLSPGLRGSFAESGAGLWSGEPLPNKSVLPEEGVKIEDGDVLKVESTDASSARKNFRVGVLVPEVVERVDLAERGGAGRRWLYALEKVNGEEKRWVEREVWP